MNAYKYIEEKTETDALLLECYELLGRIDMFPDQEIDAMKLRKRIRDYQESEKTEGSLS